MSLPDYCQGCANHPCGDPAAYIGQSAYLGCKCIYYVPGDGKKGE